MAEAPRGDVSLHSAELFELIQQGFETLAAGASGKAAHAAEAAAIKAAVALVLKLSETQFRPLFHQVTEWATAPVDGWQVTDDDDGGGAGGGGSGSDDDDDDGGGAGGAGGKGGAGGG
eukprot:SAG22_NODE_9296_length_598_cov_0.895792_1_plen_117_part_10